MAKIAIVGTGISGLGAAYLLHPRHEITVYEKAPRIGGHTRTMSARYGDADIPVDTGFIVFNERNYPHLTAMFRHLGVKVHKSEMTFAATINGGWLEWGAKNLNAIFGQRRNMLRPRFYRLVRDVMRFNSHAEATVARRPRITLGELIRHLELGDWFKHYYILPMGGAIWSCPPREMLSFPALAFVRFFANHGLLSVSGQPQWYTVTNGAQSYIDLLTAPFAGRIRTGCGAARVTREDGKVRVSDARGNTETYDEVVLACHGNEARALLGDANAKEAELLGAFRYQKNHAVLHKDVSFMPKRQACWASWVYHADGSAAEPAISVSYWMNSLQGIDRRYPLFVTLNPTRRIAPEHVFDEHDFEHPVFDEAAIAAQSQLRALQGFRNTWFCGAHLGHGFHEDGLRSAVEVARGLGAAIPWSLPERRPAEPGRRPILWAPAPAVVD